MLNFCQYSLSQSQAGIKLLPATQDNTESQNLSDLDCSFQEGGQHSHATAIWEAYIKYFFHAFTHADDSLRESGKEFPFKFFQLESNHIKGKVSLEETMLKSQLIPRDDKYKFLEEMRRQTEIWSLITELQKLFLGEILQKIIYVIYKIWSAMYTPWSKANLQSQHRQLPLLCAFVHSDGQFRDSFYSTPYYQNKDGNQIIVAADEGIQDLALKLEKDLDLLCLKNCEKFPEKSQQFREFVRVVSHSVFLSAEGLYEHPKQEERLSRYQNVDQFPQFDLVRFASSTNSYSSYSMTDSKTIQRNDKPKETREEPQESEEEDHWDLNPQYHDGQRLLQKLQEAAQNEPYQEKYVDREEEQEDEQETGRKKIKKDIYE